MKKQTNALFTSIGCGKGVTPVMQEDDQINGGFTPPRQKVFTIIDLWNVQRQRRMMHAGYLL